jgi:MYXO-CTERM domain-containing protein
MVWLVAVMALLGLWTLRRRRPGVAA